MTDNIAWVELEHACDLEDEGRFEEALQCYLRSAKNGSVEAQVNLANLFGEGRGCPENSERAVYWYKRAIKSGSPEAAYNLGVHYRRQGKQRWARYWLGRAAELGDEDARFEIGPGPGRAHS